VAHAACVLPTGTDQLTQRVLRLLTTMQPTRLRDSTAASRTPACLPTTNNARRPSQPPVITVSLVRSVPADPMQSAAGPFVHRYRRIASVQDAMTTAPLHNQSLHSLHRG